MIDVPQTSFKQILSKKYCFMFEIMKNSETEKKNRKTLMIFSSRRYIGQYVRLCRNFYRILWALNNLFLCGDFLILRAGFSKNSLGWKIPNGKNHCCRIPPTPILEILECVCGPFQNGPFQILWGGTKTEIFECVCGGPFHLFFGCS